MWQLCIDWMWFMCDSWNRNAGNTVIIPNRHRAGWLDKHCSIACHYKNDQWYMGSNRSAVGTLNQFPMFCYFPDFLLLSNLATHWISHSCGTGIITAEMWRYLSNANIKNLSSSFGKSKSSLREINEQNLCNHWTIFHLSYCLWGWMAFG